MVGHFDGSRLTLSELNRFANGPTTVLGTLYWDVLSLFDQMKQGLGLYQKQFGCQLHGIGCDTWGVDFGLIDARGQLLGNPVHYRDARTDGMFDQAFKIVSRETIFEQTGIQFMQINTLFQLLAMRLQHDPQLEQAARLLMVPDLFNYWLTGIQANEFTEATTSQMYDPRQNRWAYPLLDQLGIPTGMLGDIVQPGTILGPLDQNLADEVGLSDVPVVAIACHDTGSAVAAVPAEIDNYVYISSGTWSLIGIESPQPIINAQSLQYNFTNEGGVAGTIRFLKNIMGMWILQECRRIWASQDHAYSWDQLTAMAAEAPAFGPLIDPDAHDFLQPGDMPARIQAFCARTGQAVPETHAEIARTVLESLTLRYRWALEKLELLMGRKMAAIHIVGGGCQNHLLCQLTADCCQVPVIAGPIEATAIGNVLMQAIARGEIADLAEARQVVRQSFDVITFAPRFVAGWDDAYAVLLRVCQ
jgi:rhamnulokinase